MEPQNRTVERILGRIGAAAHGVVTRAELLSAGVTAMEIRRRLRSGALIREYSGVYRVGHRAPSLEARYIAAVKACGEGALLCGRAGAYLHRLVKGREPPPEVVAPTERRVPGIITHRSRRPDPRDATSARGIPVTTVARTLVDLAAGLTAGELARACHEAGVRHRTTPAQVEAVLARRPNSPGQGKLRMVMSGEVRVALSKLERRFLALMRRERLPPPVTNKPAGGRRVDCRWPERRLTAELDSYTYHHTRHAWEQDRRREREAYARGDEFRRYTWNDVFEDPRLMLAELRRLIGPAAARPPSPAPSRTAGRRRR